MSDGVETSYRVPVFDLEISAQQENPYKTMEYNQLALQLFQMGFFFGRTWLRRPCGAWS